MVSSYHYFVLYLARLVAGSDSDTSIPQSVASPVQSDRRNRDARNPSFKLPPVDQSTEVGASLEHRLLRGRSAGTQVGDSLDNPQIRLTPLKRSASVSTCVGASLEFNGMPFSKRCDAGLGNHISPGIPRPAPRPLPGSSPRPLAPPPAFSEQLRPSLEGKIAEAVRRVFQEEQLLLRGNRRYASDPVSSRQEASAQGSGAAAAKPSIGPLRSPRELPPAVLATAAPIEVVPPVQYPVPSTTSQVEEKIEKYFGYLA